jgi:hypothetical protein
MQREELERLSKTELIDLLLRLQHQSQSVAGLKVTGKHALEEPAGPAPAAAEEAAAIADRPAAIEQCRERKRLKKDKKKPFADKDFNTRYVALKVSYLGERYHGFVTQPNDSETVEVLEARWRSTFFMY